MPPVAQPLHLFGRIPEAAPLDWALVEVQLARAETYWVVPVPRAGTPPHPRPVWGVWDDERLHLSVGGVTLRADLASDPNVTVHLDSAMDVVVVEGRVSGQTRDPAVIGSYDTKYDWSYDADTYGPLTTVRPSAVLAWRAAGPAGRDGFVQSGKWVFGSRG